MLLSNASPGSTRFARFSRREMALATLALSLFALFTPSSAWSASPASQTAPPTIEPDESEELDQQIQIFIDDDNQQHIVIEGRFDESLIDLARERGHLVESWVDADGRRQVTFDGDYDPVLIDYIEAQMTGTGTSFPAPVAPASASPTPRREIEIEIRRSLQEASAAVAELGQMIETMVSNSELEIDLSELGLQLDGTFDLDLGGSGDSLRIQLSSESGQRMHVEHQSGSGQPAQGTRYHFFLGPDGLRVETTEPETPPATP
jgi:hypothetical protein